MSSDINVGESQTNDNPDLSVSQQIIEGIPAFQVDVAMLWLVRLTNSSQYCSVTSCARNERVDTYESNFTINIHIHTIQIHDSNT